MSIGIYWDWDSLQNLPKKPWELAGLAKFSAGAGKIGEECLQDLARLVKSMCRSWQSWSRVSGRPGGSGQECLQEQVGLVQSACGSGCNWSRMSVGIKGIGLEYCWQLAELVKLSTGPAGLVKCECGSKRVGKMWDCQNCSRVSSGAD